MKRIKARSIRITILMLLMFSPVLNAGESSVRLYEEYVEIHIDKKRTARVKIKFIFTGTKNYSASLVFPVSDMVRMENFAAMWNGKSLKCEKIDAPQGRYFVMSGERYRSLIKFEVPNTETDRSEHQVSYSYKVPYMSLMKDYEAEGDYAEYILKTGSTWNGRVSKLNIVLLSELPHHKEVKYLDNSFILKPAGNGRWEFTGRDIVLEKNLRLLFIN